MTLEGPSNAGFLYTDTGGNGPVVVLLHGVLMNGSLWDEVVDGLRDRYRCIVPELPFGAHRRPMPDDANLTLESMATMIAEFLTELDLDDVTLVERFHIDVATLQRVSSGRPFPEGSPCRSRVVARPST